MIQTLNRHVKWRKDNKVIFICDCKRLIDLKISLKYQNFMKKLFSGIDEKNLDNTEKKVLSDFKKMKLLSELKIKKLGKKDFQKAMNLLDNELGKERVRDSSFLANKFKEFPQFFIGIFLGDELIGVICGFPREDYLLISEIAIDSKFSKRGFGKKLIQEFEKIAFKKFSGINVGAQDNIIEFYKSLGYKPFLLVQFEKNVYNKRDFSEFEILSVKEYGIELKVDNCNLNELKRLRKMREEKLKKLSSPLNRKPLFSERLDIKDGGIKWF